jgi:hypothetical protein
MLFLATLNTYAVANEWKLHKPANDKLWTETTEIIDIDSNTYIWAHSVKGALEPYIYFEKTTDYGKTWKTVFRRDSVKLKNFWDPDFIINLINLGDGELWAQAKNDRVIRSTDYGETWGNDFFPFDTNYIYGNINYHNGTLSCVVWPDTLAISTDKGKTWEKEVIKIDYDTSFYSKDYVDPVQSYVFGDTCFVVVELVRFEDLQNPSLDYEWDFKLLVSFDRGKTWQTKPRMDNRVCDYLHLSHDNTLYLAMQYAKTQPYIDPVGDSSTKVVTVTALYKSHDFGATIDTVLSERKDVIQKLDAIDKNIMVVITTSRVFVSNDNCNTFYESEYGEEWPTEMRPTIRDAAMSSETKGMLAFNGFIATLEAKTSISELRRKINSLAANPNPVYSGASLSVSFEVQQSGDYSYSISDLSGREFELPLASEHLSAGTHHALSFNLPDYLTAGTYFLNVKHNGEVSAMKKIVVVK